MAMLGKRRPPRRSAGHSGLVRAPQAPRQAVDEADTPVIIERLSHEGRGVATRPSGKTLFVDCALPGETVVAAVHRQRTRFDEAHVRELISASAQRVTPPCPHFGSCGGCSLQHMTVDAQREHKKGVVTEWLGRQGLVINDEIEGLFGERSDYRRRARIGVNLDRQGQVIMGFRAAGSHRLVRITECPVLVPALSRLLKPLQALLQGLDAPRDVGHLELVAIADQPLIVVRQVTPRPADRQRWQQFGAEQAVAIALDGGQPSAQSASRPLEWVTPAPRLRDPLPLPGLPQAALAYEPGDFIQVNAEVNHRMLAWIIERLAPAPAERCLDLYAGIGNFSFPLALSGASVTAVEGSAAMVERLKANAVRLALSIKARQANLEQTAAVTALLAEEAPELVLLDPPRQGAEAVCKALARSLSQPAPGASPARRIAYVSCNPATLARDVAHLVHGGYRIRHVAVADIFVHTSHLETLMILDAPDRRGMQDP